MFHSLYLYILYFCIREVYLWATFRINHQGYPEDQLLNGVKLLWDGILYLNFDTTLQPNEGYIIAKQFQIKAVALHHLMHFIYTAMFWCRDVMWSRDGDWKGPLLKNTAFSYDSFMLLFCSCFSDFWAPRSDFTKIVLNSRRKLKK